MRKAVTLDAQETRWYDEVRAVVRRAKKAAEDSEDLESLLDLRKQLLEQLNRVNAATNAVKGQLDEARRAHAANGRHSDWEWYTRAEAAVRSYGRLSQEVQTTLGLVRQRTAFLNREAEAPPDGEVNLQQVIHLWRRLGVLLGELEPNEWEEP